MNSYTIKDINGLREFSLKSVNALESKQQTVQQVHGSAVHGLVRGIDSDTPKKVSPKKVPQ